VLASIPRLVSGADAARQARQRWLATASIALGLALVVAASYHLAHGNDQLVHLLSRGTSGPEPRRVRLGGAERMYLTFYGLNEKQFNLTPDPSFLHLTPGERQELTQHVYSERVNCTF